MQFVARDNDIGCPCHYERPEAVEARQKRTHVRQVTHAMVHVRIHVDHNVREEENECGLTRVEVDEQHSLAVSVRFADCSVKRVAVHVHPSRDGADGLPDYELSLRGLGIEAISSIPSKTTNLDLRDNPSLQTRDFSIWPELREIDLQRTGLKSLDDMAFPEKLEKLFLDENELSDIEMLADLKYLQVLSVRRNELTHVHALASTLRTLNAQENKIFALQDVVLPPRLQILRLEDNGLHLIQRVDFSHALRRLDLRKNPIQTFIVSADDTFLFKDFKNDDPGIVLADEPSLWNRDNHGTFCPGFDSYPQELAGYPMCVVPERQHQSIRGIKHTEAPIAPQFERGQQSIDLNDSLPILFLTLGITLVGIATLLFIKIHRKYHGKDRSDEPELGEQNDPSTPHSRMKRSGLPPWADLDLQCDAIDSLAWIAERTLSSKRYFEIYIAQYAEQRIVVKQARQSHAKDGQVIANFMKEIRLCARLSHPHLVSFVGVCWELPSEMAYACAFMPRGHLHALLQTQSEASDDDFQWLQQSKQGLPAKIDIAIAIAEALQYLHCLEVTPIAHQDLNSRGVLLDDDYQVRLSLFGIFNPLTMNDHVSEERDNVAWVAPEILQGRKCTTASNVYSLGMIMAELDTHRKPFASAQESRVLPDNASSARLAIAISSGTIRPVLSSSCSPSLRAIISSCWSLVPDHRPSIDQVLQDLISFHKSQPVSL